MKNSLLSKKILFVPVACAVVLCIIMYFVFSSIKNKNQHISMLDNEIFQQNKSQQNASIMQKMVQDSAGDISKINNSIVPSDGDVRFIENLETRSRSNGLNLSIDSLTFEENTKLASSSIVLFKIKARTSGNWAGMYKFLAELESLPVKIRINNFSLTTSLTSKVWESTFEIDVLKYK